VSGLEAFGGQVDLLDLDSELSYRPDHTHAQARLAQLMFAAELDRRSVGGHWRITSTAAVPQRVGLTGRIRALLPVRGGRDFVHEAEPVLLAATGEARGGAVYGRDPGLGQIRAPRRAVDVATAARLWRISEELTGVFYGDASAADGSGQISQKAGFP
jgi:hypothetical protein